MEKRSFSEKNARLVPSGLSAGATLRSPAFFSVITGGPYVDAVCLASISGR